MQSAARPLTGQTIRSLPVRRPGLYTLFRDGRPVYVGESDNLRRRLAQHLLSHKNVRDPLLPSYTFGVWTPPDVADSTARWGYETWLIGNYPQYFRHQTVFQRRQPAREAEADRELDRRLDGLLDLAIGPVEYAHERKTQSTGSRTRTRGKHQKGEARYQAARARTAIADRQRDAATQRQWRARAVRLTGVENPTEALVRRLINDLDARILAIQDQVAAARKAGDEALRVRLDRERGSLIVRLRELRSLRFEV
jgi:hypothetical protein